MEKRGRPRAIVMHDPLAVAVALDPSLVRTQAVPVEVETRGELTRGQTLADFRGTPGRIGVALEVEARGGFGGDQWLRGDRAMLRRCERRSIQLAARGRRNTDVSAASPPGIAELDYFL